MIKSLESPRTGWGRKGQEYYIHPLPSRCSLFIHKHLVLHTAQMGFPQNEWAAALPLELLLCLNLSRPRGLKQKGRSTAGGCAGRECSQPACLRVQLEERLDGSSAS